MKENHQHTTDTLLRYLAGELSAEEAAQLATSLMQSASLRSELAQLSATQDLLKEVTTADSADALDPFFTDRLMKKLDPAQSQTPSWDEELAGLLVGFFRPVAIAGLFLALCLAVYNINLSNGYTVDSTTTESILAIPSVSTMAVYDLDYFAEQTEALP
ncbi:MAG: hypothetical protein AAF564_06730 [Bacteroidota bacterium]